MGLNSADLLDFFPFFFPPKNGKKGVNIFFRFIYKDIIKNEGRIKAHLSQLFSGTCN